MVTLEALYTCLVDGYKGGGSLVAAVKAAFEKPAGKRVRWLVMWIGVFGLLPGLLARHEQRYPIHCACTTSYLRFTHADGLHVRLGWPVGWWPTGVVDLGDVLQAPFGLIADIFLVGALAAFIMLGVIAIYRLVIAVRSKGSGAAPLAQGDSHVTDDH